MMGLGRFRVATTLTVAITVAACGQSERTTSGTTTASTGTGGNGGSTAASGGSGGAQAVYPAPHPVPPKVISGGTVMTTPKVVTVSFAGDPLEGDIDTFATSIANTTYWGDATKEYGVAALAPLARVHDTFAPPTTFADADIQTWLLSRLDGTHSEWPAPDANTLYALYFPPGVTITAPQVGSSCTGFHGYHGSTQLADGTPVVYAVISRCASIPEDPTATGINYVSAVASHEVIEAITDPLVMTNDVGYSQTDNNHLVWSFIGLAELADMCALVGNAFYTPTDFPYEVQRIWSNATAMTGHDPCLPEPSGEVYFNAAPVLDDNVKFNVQGFPGQTKGVQIPVGDTKSVELDLFSEAPTPGPWNLSVSEVGGSNLDFTLDKKSGMNGDKVMLTIHVKSKNPTYGSEIFIVRSSLADEQTFWVGLVGN